MGQTVNRIIKRKIASGEYTMHETISSYLVTNKKGELVCTIQKNQLIEHSVNKVLLENDAVIVQEIPVYVWANNHILMSRINCL